MDVRESSTLTINGEVVSVHPNQPNLMGAVSTLTVIQTVYWQQAGQQPTSCDNRISRWVGSDEQPYTRTFQVGPEWQPLDIGWIEKVSLIVIENLPTRFSVMPTPKERADAEARTVEIGMNNQPQWVVLPGNSFVGVPANMKSVLIRSGGDKTKIVMRVFPG